MKTPSVNYHSDFKVDRIFEQQETSNLVKRTWILSCYQASDCLDYLYYPKIRVDHGFSLSAIKEKLTVQIDNIKQACRTRIPKSLMMGYIFADLMVPLEPVIKVNKEKNLSGTENVYIVVVTQDFVSSQTSLSLSADIQNSLRNLSRFLQVTPPTTLTFVQGDLVEYEGELMRTQELAIILAGKNKA